jgi:hypothetical protein
MRGPNSGKQTESLALFTFCEASYRKRLTLFVVVLFSPSPPLSIQLVYAAVPTSTTPRGERLRER